MDKQPQERLLTQFPGKMVGKKLLHYDPVNKSHYKNTQTLSQGKERTSEMHGGSGRRAGKAIRDRCSIPREVSWIKQGSNLWLSGNSRGSKSLITRGGKAVVVKTNNQLKLQVNTYLRWLHIRVVARFGGTVIPLRQSESVGVVICMENIVKL